MSKRRSRRRSKSNKTRWIVIGVTVVVLVLVGVLIAVSRPSTPVEQVDSDYEGLTQETVITNDAPGVAVGDPDAPVTLVDYSDFSCPHCYDLATEAIHPLIEEYVRTGQLRIVYKPIAFVNPPYSQPAAKALLCAADQGSGWEMHDQIWAIYSGSGPGAYTQRTLVQQAEAIGLDMNEFRTCFASAETTQEMQAVLTEAQLLGVQGTPTLYLNGSQITYQGPAATYGIIKQEVEAAAGG